MIFVVVALLVASLGSSITLWQGVGLYVPTLLLLTAATGLWRTWVCWLAVLFFTLLFVPLDAVTVIFLCLLSVGGYFLFSRWLDPDNLILSFTLMAALLAVFVVGDALAHQALALRTLGSFFLSLPIILGWFLFEQRKLS